MPDLGSNKKDSKLRQNISSQFAFTTTEQCDSCRPSNCSHQLFNPVDFEIIDLWWEGIEDEWTKRPALLAFLHFFEELVQRVDEFISYFTQISWHTSRKSPHKELMSRHCTHILAHSIWGPATKADHCKVHVYFRTDHSEGMCEELISSWYKNSFSDLKLHDPWDPWEELISSHCTHPFSNLKRHQWEGPCVEWITCDFTWARVHYWRNCHTRTSNFKHMNNLISVFVRLESRWRRCQKYIRISRQCVVHILRWEKHLGRRMHIFVHSGDRKSFGWRNQNIRVFRHENHWLADVSVLHHENHWDANISVLRYENNWDC